MRNDFVKIQRGGTPSPNFTQGGNGLTPPPETAYEELHSHKVALVILYK